jgi:predicted transcriptional regulator of viral defense system
MPGRNFKRLFDVAEENYGYVTTEAAREIGIRPQRLAEMAARGGLRREALGLYRLNPYPTHELDDYRKATLWPRGTEGVLSHETALELYDLGDVNPAKIHITVPKGYRIRRREPPPAYVFHHEELDEIDATRFEGIPIVTVATALRQCNREGLRRDLLRQALEEGREVGLVHRDDYLALLHELGLDRLAASPH